MPSKVRNITSFTLNGALEAAEVRRQVDLILISPGLVRSKRLGALLRYLVEESLDGREDRIKAFTIAQDVFERDASFDQQTDAIVRVEVGRLRRRLDQYYQKDGQDCSIRIEIPKGTYRPIISPRTTTSAGSSTTEGIPSFGRASWNWKPTTLIGIAIVTVILAVGLSRSLFMPEKPPALEIPIIAVLPFDVGEVESLVATGIENAIVSELSKSPRMRLIAPATAERLSPPANSRKDFWNEFGISHFVKGNLAEESGEVIVAVQLTDSRTGEVVWADRIHGSLVDLFELEREVVTRVGIAIPVMADADQSGRIYLPHTESHEALELFRIANREAYPRVNQDRVLAARELYHRVIELDPQFAGGYAGVASTYFNSGIYATEELRTKNLNNMLEYSQKAVDVDFEFGMGHAVLGLAYAVANQPDLALSHSRIAVSLQPSDTYSLESLAANLIKLGKPGEAIEYLEKALLLNPLAVGTPYLNLIGMAHLHLGEYERSLEAAERNATRGGPKGPQAQVLMTVLYAELGRLDEARDGVTRLKNMFPAFPYNKFMTVWFPESDVGREVFKILR
jgi:adenylate cyclase